MIGHAVQVGGKLADIHIVQCRLYLIDENERRGIDPQDGKVDADGHKGLLAAGKGGKILDNLAGRLHDNLDARF